MNEHDFSCLAETVNKLTDINLSDYKTAQMSRRLDSFISNYKVPDITAYCDLLRQDNSAVSRLRNFLTINVSEFYRDKTHFDSLQKVILPDLLRQSSDLTIWSAGCSNGSEAYSVALILEEKNHWSKHRILGTDIDEASLARARAGGPYRPADVRNVPPAILDKYFTKVDDNYIVMDRIKRKVQFRAQDILNSVYDDEYDLILCRNVVIYFTSEAKKRLNKNFYRSLKPGGVLFIGGTETMLDAHSIGFERMSPCFFRKPVTNGYGKVQAGLPELHMQSGK